MGGAGTGKTTELLNLMEGAIQRSGLDVDEIGFVSFTRAARAEAAERAAARFNTAAAHLTRDGWFRTLHSCCYKLVGRGHAGELVVDDKASVEWLQEALQEPVSGVPDASDDDGAPILARGKTDADKALAVWSLARSRCESLEECWTRATRGWAGLFIPHYDRCRELIERYETAKRVDHRCDFTDLLAFYAGFRFEVEAVHDVAPYGEVPPVQIWFLDEQQDSSALLDAVCKRLTSRAKWVYVTGDPFQSIYEWAGADSTHMMRWPIGAGKQRVMAKSYRCGPRVMALGEQILFQCDDYWNRRIAAADHETSIERWLERSGIADVRPDESWLLLARTNELALAYGAQLNNQAIPWLPTKGNGTWAAKQRHAGIRAMWQIEQGAPIDGGQWAAAIKLLPAKLKGGPELLTRGTKARFDDKKFDAAEAYPFVLPKNLSELGCTPALASMLASGAWRKIKGVEPDMYLRALERWGQEAIENTKVRVGTIHSVKGAEADNVVVSTEINKPVAHDIQFNWGRTTEARVWYVAVTRARRRLILLDNPRDQYRYPL